MKEKQYKPVQDVKEENKEKKDDGHNETSGQFRHYYIGFDSYKDENGGKQTTQIKVGVVGKKPFIEHDYYHDGDIRINYLGFSSGSIPRKMEFSTYGKLIIIVWQAFHTVTRYANTTTWYYSVKKNQHLCDALQITQRLTK